jgi:thioester reductase-like protein
LFSFDTSKSLNLRKYYLVMTSHFAVQSYYKDKNILITGCTGFLAKIVLEKIIRSCSDFGKIYVMMRTKKTKPLE